MNVSIFLEFGTSWRRVFSLMVWVLNSRDSAHCTYYVGDWIGLRTSLGSTGKQNLHLTVHELEQYRWLLIFPFCDDEIKSISYSLLFLLVTKSSVEVCKTPAKNFDFCQSQISELLKNFCHVSCPIF
jgi:hypothetical protein